MTRHLPSSHATAGNFLSVLLKLLLASSYRRDKMLIFFFWITSPTLSTLGCGRPFTSIPGNERGAMKQWIPGMMWKALTEPNLHSTPGIKWEMGSQDSIHDWRAAGTKGHDIIKDRRKWVSPVDKSQQEGWEKQHLKRWILLQYFSAL